MSSAPTPAPGTSTYRERLVPGPAGVAAVVLFAVMCGLVVLVSSTVAAAITSLTVLVVGLVLVAVTSPVVEVRGRELHAGRAHIPVDLLGETEVLDADGVRTALGPGYDPRSFACLRTWTKGAVTARVLDPADPTPSWLVSTRRPAALRAAIEAARGA
ncbi:DUF3093 domain-containing protein [Flavimobilis sp. GY10621]|uniref:DUF3093 domain-containing protein n=1 Tax=Flavimobilis rhizosphaerae TaxID=2775421 RepID=A0ABR9DT48_9MICO|nr:DUF3093 domain-containing protein [Flavimobilis rhizosphaerae]MBD9700292.1 DUF3093 domain-containing protein [Flavimobilis rhizosphaerae]